MPGSAGAVISVEPRSPLRTAPAEIARISKGPSEAQRGTAAAPLTIRQILAVFERAGRTLSAKNGYGILHKSLRNHQEFDSLAGTWRLIASPYPARVDDLHAGPQERAG